MLMTMRLWTFQKDGCSRYGSSFLPQDHSQCRGVREVSKERNHKQEGIGSKYSCCLFLFLLL